jgi:hypothetical protein
MLLIKNMFKKLNICDHSCNYNKIYFVKNNTPMFKFICFDCLYRDEGPVITGDDIEDWDNHVIVRNGKEIKVK